jgi:hypothetical protein
MSCIIYLKILKIMPRIMFKKYIYIGALIQKHL